MEKERAIRNRKVVFLYKMVGFLYRLKKRENIIMILERKENGDEIILQSRNIEDYMCKYINLYSIWLESDICVTCSNT